MIRVTRRYVFCDDLADPAAPTLAEIQAGKPTPIFLDPPPFDLGQCYACSERAAVLIFKSQEMSKPRRLCDECAEAASDWPDD